MASNRADLLFTSTQNRKFTSKFGYLSMKIPRPYCFDRLPALLAALIWLAAVSPCLNAQSRQNREASSTQKGGTNEPRVARGKYIVEGVAMCGMCHTPRTDSGEIDRERTLDGAVLWLLPARPTGDWPLKAPRIAGSPAASDDDLIRLLTTGIWTTGARLRPPMPQFRMSREDAEAVVAYLRSLTPRSGD